jgi:hypothetical protein
VDGVVGEDMEEEVSKITCSETSEKPNKRITSSIVYLFLMISGGWGGHGGTG